MSEVLSNGHPGLALTVYIRAYTGRADNDDTEEPVRATADTTISATPDQALISVGVETRAATAQEAAAQNAVQTQAVLDALRKQLGANAEIKTTNYTVSPLYNYPPNASPC